MFQLQPLLPLKMEDHQLVSHQKNYQARLRFESSSWILMMKSEKEFEEN
jgi:hypothetical protein